MDEERYADLQDAYQRHYDDAVSQLSEALDLLHDDYGPAILPLVTHLAHTATYLENYDEEDTERVIAEMLLPYGLAYSDDELIQVG